MRQIISATLVIVAFPIFVGNAHAQQNELFLLQDNPVGSPAGNVLFVDQSEASGSRIAGSDDGLEPARQIGAGNSADIVVEGQDISVLFTQGTADAPGFGNSASLDLTGTNLAATLEQIGSNNTGSVTIGGSSLTAYAQGSLLQRGDGNDGRLRVDGDTVSGTLIQTGNNNVTDLTVSGADTAITYEIVGDGVTALNNGPSVFSNAGTVTVRQIVPGAN